MASKLNKHTPNSDELLKRLESNDSSGLDDFEKEALEGFDSLENVGQAKEFINSLNQKIDEKYLNKEGGNKKGIMYLSMAAGLVLIVGLSYFFMTFLGQDKEMAMSPATKTSEQLANEVAKPVDIAPLEEAPKTEGKSVLGGATGSGEINTVTVTDALAQNEKEVTGSKDISNLDRREQQPDKDDGLKTRLVVKEKKPESVNEPNKLADFESDDKYKKQESDKSTVKGPPAGNVAVTSPAVVEDQKANPTSTAGKKGKEEEASEKISLSKNSDANNAPRNDVAKTEADGKSGKVDTKKSPSPKKARSKEKNNGEGLAGDDIASTTTPTDETTVKPQTTVNQTAVGSEAKEPKRDESGYVHNAEFTNRAYNKPQDYIKVEIDRSEMLKTNVKAFKAELTINEKGLVTAVKFLTDFDNCTGCKKELEKILLNMPGWKAATKGEKTVTETVSFIYP